MKQESINDQYDFMFKTILIGNSGVGKSNILLRFTREQFNQSYQTTVGVQYASKNVQAKHKIIKLQIWDTAGQQKFKAIMKTYFKGASAAFLVYDITDIKSFKNLDYWYNQIKEYSKNEILIMLLGNKCDLNNQRQVSKQQALQYAQNKKIAFYETSAKDGTNISLIFTKIAEQLQKFMLDSLNEVAITGIQNKEVSIRTQQTSKMIKLQKRSMLDSQKNKKSGCCLS